jgi:hypothetical protein
MHSAFLREEETLSVAADDEIVRIRIERDHKLETLRRVDFASEEDYSGRRTTIEAEAAEKIRRIREDRDARDAARRRTMAAENGSAIEKLDADHENRIEQLREGLRRTSLAGEQQRIRQEIEDESEAHSKKRDLLQREIDDRLRAGALAVDRKKYEEQLGYLKTQADLDDEIRAREEAGSNEQLAQEFLRIQQAHDRERAELEVLHGEKLISEAKYQDQVRQLEERTRLDRLKAAGEASSAGAFVNPLVQNWQSGLTQMLQGTYQWSNLTKNILASLVGSFAQGAAQMATEWLGQEALRFAGWAAIKVKELALHTATEATKTTTTLSGTAARIPAEAGEAAVLAGASAAAVPGIGWLIALPAAAPCSADCSRTVFRARQAATISAPRIRSRSFTREKWCCRRRLPNRCGRACRAAAGSAAGT